MQCNGNKLGLEGEKEMQMEWRERAWKGEVGGVKDEVPLFMVDGPTLQRVFEDGHHQASTPSASSELTFECQ